VVSNFEQTGSTTPPSFSGTGSTSVVYNTASGSNLFGSSYATATSSSVTYTLGAGSTSNSAFALAAYYQQNGVSLQSYCTSSGTSCVLGSAPANGSGVIGVEYVETSCSLSTIIDSNLTALSQRVCDNSANGSILDYAATGSPSATYTCASGRSCNIINTSDVTIPGSYGYNIGSPASAQTISTTAGDLVVCVIGNGNGFAHYAMSGTTLGNSYVTINNGLPTGSVAESYGYASGPSATCDPQGSAGFAAIADYTPATASPTNKACSPFPWPCLFQSGYEPRRKAALADLLR
jgi:hypothetical protein